MAAFTVRPALLPSIANGVAHVQFALLNRTILTPSPADSLTLGFAHVSLPVIFVCALAMTAIPQSSAGTRIAFRIRPPARGGIIQMSGRSRSILGMPCGARKNAWESRRLFLSQIHQPDVS